MKKYLIALTVVISMILSFSALSFADVIGAEKLSFENEKVISKTERMIDGIQITDIVTEEKIVKPNNGLTLRSGSFTSDVILKHKRFFSKNGVTYIRTEAHFNCTVDKYKAGIKINDFKRVYVRVNNGDFWDLDYWVVEENGDKYSPAEATATFKVKSGLLVELGFIEENSNLYYDYKIYPDHTIECELSGI